MIYKNNLRLNNDEENHSYLSEIWWVKMKESSIQTSYHQFFNDTI